MCFSTIIQPFPMAEILKLDVSILPSHVVTENQVFITCHLFLVIYGYT